MISPTSSLKMSRGDKFDLGRTPPAGFSSSCMRPVGRMQSFHVPSHPSLARPNMDRRANKVLMINVASKCFTDTDISSELESL